MKTPTEYRQSMVLELSEIQMARKQLIGEIAMQLARHFQNSELIAVGRVLKIGSAEHLLALIKR